MKRLLESTEWISEEAGIKIFWDCVDKMSKLTFPKGIKLTPYDFTFEGFFRATHCQGYTRIYTDVNQLRQELGFNSYMLRQSLEDMLINTIYHELCHVLVDKYLINTKVISARPQNPDDFTITDKIAYTNELAIDNGHGPLWLDCAAKVNATLKPKIPISAYCSTNEVESLLSANDDLAPAVHLYCPKCDNDLKFLAISKFDLPEPVIESLILNELFLGESIKLHKPIKTSLICRNCKEILYIKIEKDLDALRDLIAERLKVRARELFKN